MTVPKLIVLAGFLLCGTLVCKAGLIKDKKSFAADDHGFAVVELFTSEGCSSCPPADQLIAVVEKENEGKPVYILAYHVDYWNRLGWTDIFSEHAYSLRQKQYSKWLRTSQVYTPQVVVNGVTEFIGSEQRTLRNTVKAALRSSAGGTLSLSSGKKSGHQIEIQYRTEIRERNHVLMLAVLQKTGRSIVKNGENSGRTLAHVQIVRKIKSIDLDGKYNGRTILELPSGLDSRNTEIIGFVQDLHSGRIRTAAKLTLNNALMVSTSPSKKALRVNMRYGKV